MRYPNVTCCWLRQMINVHGTVDTHTNPADCVVVTLGPLCTTYWVMSYIPLLVSSILTMAELCSNFGEQHSKYYCQVQVQLHITESKICNLFMFTLTDVFLQDIETDLQYWYCTESLLPKLDCFYHRYFRQYIAKSLEWVYCECILRNYNIHCRQKMHTLCIFIPPFNKAYVQQNTVSVLCWRCNKQV